MFRNEKEEYNCFFKTCWPSISHFTTVYFFFNYFGSNIFSTLILSYQYKWLNNTPATIFNDAKKFRNRLVNTSQLDCTDLDDAGMTCYLAHTLEDKNVCFTYFLVCF
jgi:hypothetical protein